MIFSGNIGRPRQMRQTKANNCRQKQTEAGKALQMQAMDNRGGQKLTKLTKRSISESEKD
jgi:hypothetical protein